MSKRDVGKIGAEVARHGPFSDHTMAALWIIHSIPYTNKLELLGSCQGRLPEGFLRNICHTNHHQCQGKTWKG
eukprot:7645772-Prorocentrum_lima.AAC.1